MDYNYANPVQLPSPSDYTMHGPFGISMPTALSYQAGANQRQTAAPFLQQMQQGQQMGLQRQQMDLGEYMGAEAQDQRSAERRAKTSQSEQDILNAPVKGAYDREDWLSKRRLLPEKEKEERAKLAELYNEHKGKPTGYYQELSAAAFPAMQAAKSDMERASIYGNMVNQWKAKYPNEPLPDYLQSYNPQSTMGVLGVNHAIVVNNAKHQQEMAKQAQMDAAHMERTRTEQAGALTREQEQVAGANKRNQDTIDAGRTAEMRLLSVRRQLADPTLAEPKKQALRDERVQLEKDSIEKTIDSEYGKLDPTMVGIMKPDMIDKYNKARTARRNELMMQRGVPFSMSYLRQRNPGLSDAELKANAKKSGMEIEGD